MATAKPKPLLPPTGQTPLVQPGRSKRRRVLIWLGVLLLGALVFFWSPLNSYAVTGASYAARVGCSCRFIGGRGLSDCRKDFEPGMALIMLSEDKAERSVTARFPLLSTQTASYREGAGCVLEKWED